MNKIFSSFFSYKAVDFFRTNWLNFFVQINWSFACTHASAHGPLLRCFGLWLTLLSSGFLPQATWGTGYRFFSIIIDKFELSSHYISHWIRFSFPSNLQTIPISFFTTDFENISEYKKLQTNTLIFFCY